MALVGAREAAMAVNVAARSPLSDGTSMPVTPRARPDGIETKWIHRMEGLTIKAFRFGCS